MKAIDALLCLLDKGPPPTARCVALGSFPDAGRLRQVFDKVPPLKVGGARRRQQLFGISNTVAILRGSAS